MFRSPVFFIGAVLACRLGAAQPPNLVVIFTDDEGYADDSAAGTVDLRTH